MKKAILVASLLAVVCTASGATTPVPSAQGPAPWWSDRTAGLIGGIVGTVVGILGGMIGILTSMGKARSFVLGLAWGLLVSGPVALVVGLVAFLESQPYAVYYPALLVGFILTLVMGLNIRTIEARYRELELQKMRMRDAEDGGAPNG